MLNQKATRAKTRKKATVMVTSGALTFILLAATLVTASFLMAPQIEQIFSKYTSIIIYSSELTG